MNIDGVLLAAGLSKRFGRPKQLAHFRGKPLVNAVAGAALGSKLRRIVVVTGYEGERVRLALSELPGAERLQMVANPEYPEGQSTSIRRGLDALASDADAAMFLSCDQPLVTPEYLDALIDAFAASRPLICYPVCGQVRSNPAIFSAQLFADLKKLAGDIGGRVLIERYRSRILEHRVQDPRVFADVDREEDLDLLESSLGDSSEK